MWLLKEDADRLLSYNTQQQVNILDRYLGITQHIINLLVITYIVGFDLWYCKGYYEYETSRGIVATHVNGDAFVKSSGKSGERFFSSEEISYPGLENGNVFVATRVEVRTQKRGVCEDHSKPCEVDDDCIAASGEDTGCSDKGFCVEPSWCDVDEGQKELYEIPSSSFLIWVKSAIQYIRLQKDKLFVRGTDRPILYPQEHFNTFTVRQLLELCTPMPVRYEEIGELGAAIEVQLIHDCDVLDDVCTPTVVARRVDTTFDEDHIGFMFNHGEDIDDETRIFMKMRGVRIFFRSVGTGRKVSAVHIVMKISTGLALLGIGPLLVDWLMLNVFFLKEKYYARKYIESEDFSDYFAEVEQMEKEAEDLQKLADKGGDDKEGDEPDLQTS